MTSQETKTTNNHQTIKKWVEERDGKPAMIDGIMQEGRGGAMLRIYFPALMVESLKILSWELFFQILDESDLSFMYQETTAEGELSKYYRFVNKE